MLKSNCNKDDALMSDKKDSYVAEDFVLTSCVSDKKVKGSKSRWYNGTKKLKGACLASNVQCMHYASLYVLYRKHHTTKKFNLSITTKNPYTPPSPGSISDDQQFISTTGNKQIGDSVFAAKTARLINYIATYFIVVSR